MGACYAKRSLRSHANIKSHLIRHLSFILDFFRSFSNHPEKALSLSKAGPWTSPGANRVTRNPPKLIISKKNRMESTTLARTAGLNAAQGQKKEEEEVRLAINLKEVLTRS